MNQLITADSMHALGATPFPGFDDTIYGTGGDDQVTGTDNNDLMIGKSGDDVLNGLGGNDSLIGQSGDDTLLGGSGDDTLDGGGGNNSLNAGSGDDLVFATNFPSHNGFSVDTLDGGSGNDTISFAHLHQAIDFSLSSADEENVLNFENMIGTAFDDYLYGDDRTRNVIDGGAGNDWISGLSGNHRGYGDTLIGGDGNDTLLGSNHGDLLQGGDGDDRIRNAGGADTIDGGAGQDHIALNLYDSMATGGADADVFEFKAAHGKAPGESLITDLENQDRIDISHIDADTADGGDQAFTLVASLDGHAAQAALVYDGGSNQTSLLLDTDGDGTADITILLTGDHTDFTNFTL